MGQRRLIQTHVCLVVAFLLVGPRVAAAQTTSDGVRAFLLGDYEAAARILQPLAEAVPEPDPLAQYFMAMLYDSGRGVARDMFQACGMYMRAAKSANPFMSQALTTARTMQEQSPYMVKMCALAGADDGRVPPSASFVLGPDHRVAVDRLGVTVAYKGAHARTFIERDWLSVPVRHVALTISRPVSARRDFIQFFRWQPDNSSDRPAWMLQWMLFEVAGSDFVLVAHHGRLAALTGPQPPAVFDVDNAIRLQLGPNNEVEWIVPSDPVAGRGLIPPPGTR
jgi:hypothetical protein